MQALICIFSQVWGFYNFDGSFFDNAKVSLPIMGSNISSRVFCYR